MTTEERAELTARLKDARNAYHSLMTGGTIVDLTDQNGERMSFNRVNTGQLLAYIRQLEARLGIASGYLGPLEFSF